MSGNTKTFLSIDEFRQAAAEEGAEGLTEVKILQSFDTEIEKADSADSRVVKFVISTPTVDRMGDTIAAAGWQLDAYKRNPVVLWAHDASILPVAKAVNIRVEAGKLKADADFTPTPSGWPALNESVFQFLRSGLLNATSVGFRPTKYDMSSDPARPFGLDFKQQELLEYSIVPVPANAECLMQGKGMGVDIAPFFDYAMDAVRRGATPEQAFELAEDILRAPHFDDQATLFAKKLLEPRGMVFMPKSVFEAIVALPASFRSLADSLPDKAKGAKGQIKRVANIVERTLNPEEETADVEGDITTTTEASVETSVDPVVDDPVVEASAEQATDSKINLDDARKTLEQHRRRMAVSAAKKSIENSK